jgi:3-deoxy-D-manno-octulosonate 8-phosphate phosphatase (KDO 8-P phosphatase)
MEIIHDKLKNIKAFVFDVDGVMTEGSVFATEDGQFLRTFNIKDGYAIQHANKLNYPIAIISGGNSQGIIKRFQALGLSDIHVGQQHKKAAFESFLSKYNLSPSEILYMGDDMPDYELLKLVGLATCPQDAAKDIKSICHYISPLNGGKGCVRDVLEMTLKIQDKWWNNHTHVW